MNQIRGGANRCDCKNRCDNKKCCYTISSSLTGDKTIKTDIPVNIPINMPDTTSTDSTSTTSIIGIFGF